MLLEDNSFATSKERKALIERMMWALDLCDTEEDINQLWEENRENIQKIKDADAQGTSVFIEQYYPIVVELFKTRSETIKQGEALCYLKTKEN